ncbi:prenyltransferase/squalene oxidase repeat-containing protein [Clostridium lundense]|uniref:prenyltransferase/squalene oxidase repeat-containing protein n=1 Tax=Clostridium lundense TaxID=319475 RepID=UPI000486DC9A|nr:hypothetical protein [Clostridium lundense]
MSNKRRRIMSFFMVLIMILSSLNFNLFNDIKVHAQEENKIEHSMKVRVEGQNHTLFNKEVSVKDEVYVKDLVNNAIGKENVEGIDTSFITKILGEEGKSDIGWMYYLVDKDNKVIEGDVISKQEIKDIHKKYFKEMVWYMAKWTDGITCIPKVSVDNLENEYKIKVTEQNVMMGIDPRPAKELNVKVEGVGEYKTDDNGEVSFKVTPGDHNVCVYKTAKDSKGQEYPAIVRQSFTVVGQGTEESTKLEEVVKNIKKYYESKEELSYLPILSFNHINALEKNNFKLKESKNVAAIADNIMGIIAIGKSPYSYEGINYVEKLVKAQNESGKFIIGNRDEKSVTAQVEAIIALDMASAKYNVDKALEAIISSAKDGKYEDIDSTTKVLIALSKHKDFKGVNELIDSCLKDLKEKQLEGGGFDYYEMGNSPYSTAPAIQALIALGENPVSKKWTKGGRNLLDALITCKVSDNGFEMAEGMGGGFSDPTATEFAFAAIADIYRQISMYHNFNFKVEEKPNPIKIINNEIEDIKSYYEKSQGYNFSTILGLKLVGTSEEVLQNKIALNDKKNLLAASQNVISIVGIGKNPRNYNGKNYVEILSDTINSSSRANVEQLSYALIALDMISGDKKDIDSVIQKIKGKKISKVLDCSIALIALSKHKDIEGVNDIITACIDKLKVEQLDNGGFTASKTMWANGDSQDTATAIEGLIAVGKDPLSNEWTKNGKTPLDALLSFKMGKGYIYESSMGAYEQDMYTSFVLRAFIALKDKEIVFNKFNISYDGKKDKTEDIKNSIKDLKVYYSSKEKYEFREALALNYSSENISEDIKDIQNKYKVKENPANVSAYAGNIIGIIASGKDPKKYNRINYLEKLINSQVKEGEKKGKFIIAEGDGDWPTIQAYAILALDMAEANYDKEGAVKALCGMSNTGIYSDIDTTAMAITALAAHKDIKEAEDIISSSIKYLKEKQNDKGGYDAYGKVNNPCTISAVIQALVANKINPLSDEWWKNESSMLDALLRNKVNDNFGNDFANNQAFMALADLYKGESMFLKVKLIDNSPVKKTIDELKGYYEIKDKKYNYLQALALNKIGFEKEKIVSGIQFREEEPSFINFDTKTTAYAKNIIGIISAGLDAKNYKDKNYVDMLVKAQNEKGQFKLEDDDKDSIEAQAYSVIALDMCKQKYDIKAIEILKEAGKNIKDKNLSYITSIMLALSNHRDIEGVNDILNNCVNKLKEYQIEDGGFTSSIDGKNEKRSNDTSEAIQALLAVGEDVLSLQWSKNSKTPLDSLMAYKKGDHFIYNSAKSGYAEYTDDSNGKAFAALVSLYNEECIFKALNPQEPNGEKTNENKEFKINNLTDVKEFRVGTDAKITVQAINNTKEAKNAVLIVGLFNKDGKLVNYVAAKQSIESGKTVELNGIIKLPKEGEYIIKAFVWDSLQDMTQISNVIEIPVK